MATSADTMTSDQLREHLYRDLQSRGVLETMKSQLRQRIAKELHKATPIGVKRSQKPSHKRSDAKATTLDDHLASAVVADYLKKAGFEYSLSVFLPEAGVNIDKLCTMDDLVQYLRIPTSSPLHSKLVPPRQDQSLLDQLLKALVDSSVDLTSTPRPKSSSTSSRQKASPKKKEPKKSSVAEQLQALDQSYAQKAEEQRLRTQQNLEERLSTFQRDLEAQYKSQLETELSLYKSRELAKVRMEEREKYQQELASERVEATVAHQKKIEELRRTEQQMMDRYRKKEQDLESSVHSQRQTLLAEISSLKVREAELKRKTELSGRANSLEEERLNKLADQLAGREKALEKMKSHYESMVEEKAEKFKLELESQLQSRHIELSRWEAELKGDKDKMASLQSQLTKLGAELQTERDKADQLQSLLHEATGRQIALQGQKDALQQRVDQVGDYDQLQQKSQELARELVNAEKKLQEYKRRNSDNQHLIKDLQSRAPHPAQELEALKKELDEIRAAHHKEVFVMENNNKELRRQLAAQTEYAGVLQKKLDDQMLQLLSAQREVRDIHSTMEQLRLGGGRTGARRNGVPSAKRNAMISKKVPTHYETPFPLASHPHTSQGPQLSQPHTSQGPKLSQPHTSQGPQLHTSQGPQLSQPHTSQAVPNSIVTPLDHAPTTDVSSQLLAESRATIERLEKEARELEVTCHHLQQNRGGAPLKSPTNDGGSGDIPSSLVIPSHPRAYTGTLTAVQTTVSYQPPVISVSHGLPQLTQVSTVWTSPPAMATSTDIADVRQRPSTGFTVAHTSQSAMTSLTEARPSQPTSTPLPFTPLPIQPASTSSFLLLTSEQHSHSHNTSAPVSIATVSKASTITIATTAPPPVSTLSSVTAPSLSKPPKISLDELWKSSEVKSSPVRASTSVSPKDIPKEEEHKKIDHQTELPTITTAQMSLAPREERPPQSADQTETAPHEDEGVDPVMLKYMELVTQKRETAQSEPLDVSAADGGDKMDFGIPSLSQVSENYGGFSDKDDDPFEDW